MRLVMMYTVSDGCSYASDVTEPVECESVEAAEYAFDNAMLEANGHSFDFFGHDIDPYHWEHGTHPEFLTIGEWFSRYGKRLEAQNVK